MRRVVLAVSATVAGLVLLLGFKTASVHSAASKPASIVPSGTGNSTSGSTADPVAGSAGTKTVTGDSVDTRWGPVQVKITVTNGKITSAQAVDYPENNPRDEQINSFAIPQLQQETISAGNAKIDMVSGATYTSQGYIGSLQSALDKL